MRLTRCFPNDFCLLLEEGDCLEAGATWFGPDFDCADDDENGNDEVEFDDLLQILDKRGKCE